MRLLLVTPCRNAPHLLAPLMLARAPLAYLIRATASCKRAAGTNRPSGKPTTGASSQTCVHTGVASRQEQTRTHSRTCVRHAACALEGPRKLLARVQQALLLLLLLDEVQVVRTGAVRGFQGQLQLQLGVLGAGAAQVPEHGGMAVLRACGTRKRHTSADWQASVRMHGSARARTCAYVL